MFVLCYVEVKVAASLYKTYTAQELVYFAIPSIWCLVQPIQGLVLGREQDVLALVVTTPKGTEIDQKRVVELEANWD